MIKIRGPFHVIRLQSMKMVLGWSMQKVWHSQEHVEIVRCHCPSVQTSGVIKLLPSALSQVACHEVKTKIINLMLCASNIIV